MSAVPKGGRMKHTNGLGLGTDLRSTEERFKLLNTKIEEKAHRIVEEADQTIATNKGTCSAQLLTTPSSFSLKDQISDDGVDLSMSSEVLTEFSKTKVTSHLLQQHTDSRTKHVVKEKQRPRSAFTYNPSRASSRPSSRSVSEKKEVVVDGDDVLPSETAGISTEATLRFLKAKVRVANEEIENYVAECQRRDKRMAELEATSSQFTTEVTKLKRHLDSTESVLQRAKKMSAQNKARAERAEKEVTILKKECDVAKREQKQSATAQQTLETRLLRANTEVERLKAAVDAQREENKGVFSQEKQRMAAIEEENKRLVKRNKELTAACKRHLQLIDILRRQKLLLEAAKLISFTEEEFMKCIEWK